MFGSGDKKESFRSSFQRKRVQFFSKKPSLTQQSEAARCDVNTIVSNYRKTGVLPVRDGAMYGDFSNVADYQSSLAVIAKAHDQFSNLPSKIRDQFQNNPEKFLEFVSDPKNVDSMIKMGIATKHISEVDLSKAKQQEITDLIKSAVSDVVKPTPEKK